MKDLSKGFDTALGLRAFVVAVVAASMFSNLAMAADEGENEHDHPCKKIVEVCKGAGYAKGAHKSGNGLFKDCLQPILANTPVSKITVSAEETSVEKKTVSKADIQACQTKKAKRHHKS